RTTRTGGSGFLSCFGGGDGGGGGSVIGGRGTGFAIAFSARVLPLANVRRTRSTRASERNGFSIVATMFGNRAAAEFICATCPDIMSIGTSAVRSFSNSRRQT